MKQQLPKPVRLFFRPLILAIILFLLLRVFLLEVCQVNTSSMVPAIHGRHCLGQCPLCLRTIRVDAKTAMETRRIATCHCSACGSDHLVWHDRVRSGDVFLVDKTAFWFRQPRRWEIVVFRQAGRWVVKRIIGLPGETLTIRNGEIYIDEKLMRKTHATFAKMAIPLAELSEQPTTAFGWRKWEMNGMERLPSDGDAEWLMEARDHVNADVNLQFTNSFSSEAKCYPITDEYEYNQGLPLPLRPIHDFSVSAQIRSVSETGKFAIALTDGMDTATLNLDTSPEGQADWRIDIATCKEADKKKRSQKGRISFPGGNWYDISMALVDRRVTVCLGKKEVVIDLPAVTEHPSVTTPLTINVTDGKYEIRRLKLLRDVHYTDDGRNATQGRVVHLGNSQYFVLGDNSPVSMDSRFWPYNGAIESEDLIGRPLFSPFSWNGMSN